MIELGKGLALKRFILCEDVRLEMGNKHSILGAIAGDLILSVFPGSFKVAAYVDFQAEMPGKYTVEFNIRVNGEIQGTATSNFEVVEKKHVVAIVGPLSFVAKDPGSLVFEAYRPGEQPVTIDERKLQK